MPNSSWIIRTKTQPRLRLFCFPYAGGGASIYRLWSSKLPNGVEACPIQLPGHENRIAEPLYTHIAPLVAELAQVMRPYQDIPCMFFGHSLGALVAFELARYQRRNHLPEPTHLFVSAHRAPQLPRLTPIRHTMPETEFIEALHTLGGTPQAVLEHAELMNLLSPILRADFSIFETYSYTDEAPLAYPITAFGGVEDHEISLQELQSWQEQTSSIFTLKMLPGEHFFLHSHQDLLLQTLTLYLHLT